MTDYTFAHRELWLIPGKCGDVRCVAGARGSQRELQVLRTADAHRLLGFTLGHGTDEALLEDIAERLHNAFRACAVHCDAGGLMRCRFRASLRTPRPARRTQ